jgi:hypothetical protein
MMQRILVCMPTLGRSSVEVWEVPADGGDGKSTRVHDCGVLESPGEVVDAMRGLADRTQRLALGVFHGPFGGTDVEGPLLVHEGVLHRVEELAPRAPTTLPAIAEALRAFAINFPNVPSVFAHGSGFFAPLPPCERYYAIEPEEGRRRGMERTGFHGLFHAAAVQEIDVDSKVRTLSICLEPCPEAAAIVGTRPVMVTSGATPVEGLPGQTTCGEIDPGMVLILAQEHHWSPEQIAEALTQESGMLGLVGRPIDLTELFASHDEATRLARDMMLYRLQMTAGMAIATMGGLDRIVFSGRHAAAGDVIGPWLCKRLPRAVSPTVTCVDTPFVELLLDCAMKSLRDAVIPAG